MTFPKDSRLLVSKEVGYGRNNNTGTLDTTQNVWCTHTEGTLPVAYRRQYPHGGGKGRRVVPDTDL